MNWIFEAVGYLGGVCLAVSFIPQAWKTFRTQNIDGLSLGTYSIYNVGVVSWIIYGAYLHSYQMVIFNSICLCFSLPVLFMILKFSQKKPVD